MLCLQIALCWVVIALFVLLILGFGGLFDVVVMLLAFVDLFETGFDELFMCALI